MALRWEGQRSPSGSYSCPIPNTAAYFSMVKEFTTVFTIHSRLRARDDLQVELHCWLHTQMQSSSATPTRIPVGWKAVQETLDSSRTTTTFEETALALPKMSLNALVSATSSICLSVGAKSSSPG